jgi:hypothetical protein
MALEQDLYGIVALKLLPLPLLPLFLPLLMGKQQGLVLTFPLDIRFSRLHAFDLPLDGLNKGLDGLHPSPIF